MDSLAIGSNLRGFEIEGILGRGGFGIVYRARHRELGTRFAIKEYFPSEIATRHGIRVVPRAPTFKHDYMDGLRRFKEEALRLIEFSNCASIVSCRDFFRLNGTAYLVMVYVDGLPLSDLLRGREAQERPFDEDDLITVMIPLLESLAVVHTADVLHRDIKPSNILIRYSDSQPILIDFGAAKQAAAELTKSFAPYTPGYAALEQVGDGTLGPWTDVYGLGALMWRMVARGSPPNPVRIEQRALAMLKGTADPLPSAVKLGEGRFPAQILKAIDNCLAVDEDDRIQECHELIRLLDPETNHRPQRKNATSSLLIGMEVHWDAWFGRHEKILDIPQVDADVNPRAIDGMTPLHWAAWAGQTSCIRALVKLGAIVDAKDNQHQTPLHRSILAGRSKSFVCLTEAGAEIKARDKRRRGVLELALLTGQSQILATAISAGADLQMGWGDDRTLLHHAVENGSPEQIEVLLGYGLGLEAKDRFEHTPLHWAARANRPKHLVTLIKAGSNLESLNEYGETPLQGAVTNKRWENAQILINAGASVNTESAWPYYARGRTWSTPLHVAAVCGRSKVIRVLLAAQADIHVTDLTYKGTALHWAAFGRHLEAISILLDAGNDPNARAKLDATPLHWLASPPRSENFGEIVSFIEMLDKLPRSIRSVSAIIHRFLEAGSEIDSRDEDGETALHWAAQHYDPKSPIMARALIESGASVASRRNDGQTPLHLASHPETVETLIQSQSDVNAKNNNGSTPLHLASQFRILEILIRSQADVNVVDNAGNTPLHIATMKHWSRESIELLVESGVNLHARNQRGLTALQLAAGFWNHQAVKALIKAGSEVDIVHDVSSANPLLFACCPVVLRHYTYDEQFTDEMAFETIRSLLDYGANPRSQFKKSYIPSSPQPRGRSPLHFAVRHLSARVVSLLSKSNIDMNVRDADGNVPLALVGTGDREEARLKIEILISGGANVRLWAECDKDALHNASLVGSARGIVHLIDAGVHVDTTNQVGKTPLHLAARFANVRSLKTLLRLGCDVRCCDANGLNALHLIAKLPREAVTEGDKSDAHVSIIQRRVEQTIGLLCSAGCNPNHSISSSSHSTPLHLVGEFNMLSILELSEWSEFLIDEIRTRARSAIAALVEHGGHLDARDHLGRTPLLVAALWGSSDSVEEFIRLGANIHARSKTDSTALHLAAVGNWENMTERHGEKIAQPEFPYSIMMEESVRFLIEGGSDVHARNHLGGTALHSACQSGGAKIVGVILDAGSDPNLQDRMGQTALHRACKNGRPEAIDAILDAGSNPDVRDGYGRLPWDYLRLRKEIQSTECPRRFLDSYAKLDRQLRLWNYSDIVRR